MPYIAKWKENILKSFNKVLLLKKDSNIKSKGLINVKLVSKNFIILSLLFVLCMGYVDQFESNSIVKKSTDKSSNASNIYTDVQTAVSIQSEMISSSTVIYKSANTVLENSGQSNQKSEYIQTKLGTTTDDALTKSTPLITSGTPQGKIASYIVAKGENLSSVASKFNITTQTIRWNNGVDLGGEIKEGQNITILPTNGVLHTITDQDNFDSLAAKYKSTKEMIISYNGVLDGNIPKVGTKLIIPDGIIEEKPKVVVNNNTANRPVASVSSGVAGTALTNYSPRANTYSYGQCTWYAASRRNIPNTWGNANTWYSRAQASGFSVGSTPVVGAIAWTGIGYYGHVAIVEQVNGNQVLISEMNFNGNWGRATTRWIPANSYAYIY